MCDVGKCRDDNIEVIYYGYEVCDRHWRLHCDGRINLKKKLGVDE